MIKQIVNNFSLTLAASVVVFSLSSMPVGAEIRVIGNSGLSADSVSEQEAKGVWLGKRKKLSGGEAVTVSDQSTGSHSRNEFYKHVIGKGPRQMKAYWAKRVFTGKGNPPAELNGDAAVIDWVANTPGGLGYISSDEPGDSVKVLMRK